MVETVAIKSTESQLILPDTHVEQVKPRSRSPRTVFFLLNIGD